MVLRRGLLVLLLAVGCSQKKPAKGVGDALDVQPGTFIQISLDDEEDELEAMFGSELMIATAECGDLIQLEPAAMMGRLEDAQIRCLDETMRTAERMTVKDKISRVLLADAWAKGDEHRWEGVARRHLEAIGRTGTSVTSSRST